MRQISEIKKDMEEVERKLDSILGKEDKESWQTKHSLYKEKRNLEKELNGAVANNVQVGDGITLRVYSDCHAFTIIARTEKTLTIQQDKATLKNNWKPEFVHGGFTAHCTNQNEQEYDYEKDEKGQILKIRWSDKKSYWNAPRGYAGISLGRHEFYDYNF